MQAKTGGPEAKGGREKWGRLRSEGGCVRLSGYAPCLQAKTGARIHR